MLLRLYKLGFTWSACGRIQNSKETGDSGYIF